MPTARAPLIFAIWPTAEPTAPEAAATTTVSPGLRLADIEQARIGGHAGHAEHADRGRDRRDLRIDLGQTLAVGNRMGLPAGARQHDVALGKTRIVRRDHLADRAAFHHAADRHRLAHRTARRSCARACRDRATARWCAAGPRPRPGVGTGNSSRRKSDGLGSPSGREARTMRLPWDMVVSSGLLFFVIASVAKHIRRSSEQAKHSKRNGLLRRCAPRNDGVGLPRRDAAYTPPG